MIKNSTDKEAYLTAKKKVKDMKEFYTHLVIYMVVISILVYINLTYVPHFHWFWFSLIGWGIGLFVHWLAVFGRNLLGFGTDWETRKIEEYMNVKTTKNGR